MEIRRVGILCVFLSLTACDELDLTGLVYTPVPVNTRFEQSMEWNDLHAEREITVNSDTYTILIGGDAHVGGTVNLTRFIQIALNVDAAALSIAGDVCTGNREDYEILKGELEAAGEIPVLLVPGNHDLYFKGWESFYEFFGASVYTLKVHVEEADDLFIFLDTGGGTLGTKQLQWLKDLLITERSKYRNTIVITHLNFFRPRFTTSTNPLNEELIVLIDLFEKYKVNMVIQGHDHLKSEENIGHCKYIILDAMKDDNEKATYLELIISGNSITYNFKDF